MAFDTYEKSRFEGRPVSVFEFRAGPTLLGYTNHTHEIIKDGLRCQPAMIAHEGIALTATSDKASLSITADFQLEICRLFRRTAVFPQVDVVVYAHHVGDTEFVEVFRGEVVGHTVSTKSSVLVCQGAKRVGLYESANKPLRTRYCPYVLYGEQCGVDSGLHRHNSTVSGISGNTISLPAGWHGSLAPDAFLYGIAAWDVPQYYSVLRFYIIRADALFVRIAPKEVPYLNVGDAIRLYPGCDKTQQTCDTRFNNLTRYGGLLDRTPLPEDSPFVGESR